MGCCSSSSSVDGPAGRSDAPCRLGTQEPAATTKGPALTTTALRSAEDWDVLCFDHGAARAPERSAPSTNANRRATPAVGAEWNSPCPLTVAGGSNGVVDAAPPGEMDLFPFLPDVTPPLAAVGAALPAVTHDRHDDRARPPEGLLGSPSVSAILLNDLQEGSQPSAAALSRSDVVLRRSPRSAPQPAARPSPFSSPIAAGTAPAQGSGGVVELPAAVMSMRWAAGGGGSAAPPPRQARDPAKPPPRQPTAPRRRVPPKTP